MTLRVVDKDYVTKDDPIGFVEFCVADLQPNGSVVRGWLELRKMEHFTGTAKRRFLKHRRRRDDNFDEEDDVQTTPLRPLEEIPEHDDWDDDLTLSSAVRRLNGKELARSVSKAAETVKSQVKSQVKSLQTRVANAHPPRPQLCCAGFKGEGDEETKGFLKWRKRRLNAGETGLLLRNLN